mmetsp:Transcript_5735/g.7248  ORF Transcript_5735/g.7248 Transcript_5735/m.7248 type:complete len:133 (+) Transcript_5735:1776-2174(+)
MKMRKMNVTLACMRRRKRRKMRLTVLTITLSACTLIAILGEVFFSNSTASYYDEEMCSIRVPINEGDIFPTVTLCSPNTAVRGRFVARDIPNLFDALEDDTVENSPLVSYWRDCDAFAHGQAVVALDGNRVL